MEETKLLKTAAKLQEAMQQVRQFYYLECLRRLTLLSNKLQEIGSESRKLGIAMTRQWSAASNKCCIRAERAIGEIPHYITGIQELFAKRQTKAPTLSDVFEELKAVQAEFGDIEVSKSDQCISVTTEPITLEGVYLGPFRILLCLDLLVEMYHKPPYIVYAAEPNPAASDSSVTHPHISSDTLCTGDGYAAIKAALEAGRFADFFTIIRSILNTYNPDSAYVAMEDWEGSPCYECGYTMQSDQIYYCSSCDNSFCDECSACCENCNETICLSCAGRCQVCEVPLCHRCQFECSECERVCCESCLEEGICSDCREEKEQNDEEEPINEEKVESKPDSQQVRMAG